MEETATQLPGSMLFSFAPLLATGAVAAVVPHLHLARQDNTTGSPTSTDTTPTLAPSSTYMDDFSSTYVDAPYTFTAPTTTYAPDAEATYVPAEANATDISGYSAPTDAYGDYGNATQGIWLHNATVSGQLAQVQGNWLVRGFYISSDIDYLCRYPDPNDYPMPVAPRDIHGDWFESPNLAVWQALRMDDWLHETISSCPMLLEVRQQGTNGMVREPFPRVLARLMLGSTPNATPAIDCVAFRCAWSSTENGEVSLRGNIYGPNWNPRLQDGMSTAFLEVYRRWLALQALANVWDFHQASAKALEFAVPLVSPRVTSIMNSFNPRFNEPQFGSIKAGDILNLISSIAAFTPLGPFVSIAASAANLGIALSEHNKDKSSTYVDKLYDNINAFPTDSKSTAERVGKDMSEADREKLAAGVQEAKDQVIKYTGKSVKVASALYNIYRSKPGQQVSEASWDPTLDVDLARFSDELSGIFFQVAANQRAIARDSLNGDPWAPGGYMSMVTGGVFSQRAGFSPTLGEDNTSYEVSRRIAWSDPSATSLMPRINCTRTWSRCMWRRLRIKWSRRCSVSCNGGQRAHGRAQRGVFGAEDVRNGERMRVCQAGTRIPHAVPRRPLSRGFRGT